MAWAKRNYILIIKVNKLWKYSPTACVPTAFLVLPNFLNRNTVHVFYFSTINEGKCSSFYICGVSTAGLQSLFLPLDFCNVVQGFGSILFAQMELLYYLLHVSRCICGYLSSKPRILVTHQLQYLKEADQLLVLSDVSMSYFQFHNRFVGFWNVAQQCSVR